MSLGTESAASAEQHGIKALNASRADAARRCAIIGFGRFKSILNNGFTQANGGFAP